MFPDLDMGVYIKINNNYCLDKKKEFGIFEN